MQELTKMHYPRDYKKKIEELSNFFPVLVLSGARQSGKTTLLRSLFPKHSYVTLDVPQDAQLAEESPSEFLSLYPPPILIDEVQYAPKLFRHLKVEVDKQREKAGKFILTGSQKFTLMKNVSDSLAGRAAILDLENLSLHELGTKYSEYREKHGIAKTMLRGFFPELWKSTDFPVLDYFRSYLATYLERDVRQILNVASLRDFDRFMRVCALRSGNLLNKDEIAKEVGITAKTVNDWLSVLEASNQISLLEPYFENFGKRVVKSPKLYFNDVGLLIFLLGLNETNLSQSYVIGAIWETFVFAELRKYLHLYKPESSLWFYRNQKHEVDFLIMDGTKCHFLGCKWSEVADTRDFKPLLSIAKQFSKYETHSYIVTRSHGYPVTEDLKTLSGFNLHSFIKK